MTQPTNSQLRALQMFREMAALPQDNIFIRASAVGRCLMREGVDVSLGWFSQLDLPDGSIVDVEVLEIDEALVDVKGIHQGWDDVSLVNGGDKNSWRALGFKGFSPADPGWLGTRGGVHLERAVSALSARMQQLDLAANTIEAATARPAPRM